MSSAAAPLYETCRRSVAPAIHTSKNKGGSGNGKISLMHDTFDEYRTGLHQLFEVICYGKDKEKLRRVMVEYKRKNINFCVIVSVLALKL